MQMNASIDSAGPSPIPEERAAWLRRELDDWQRAGLVDAAQAAAIGSRYRGVEAHRRVSLGRILLVLGAAFVGVGLIWLVAANLDQLPPLLRFAAVAAIWLALMAGAELSRAAGAVRGALRLMASLAFGAVIFQAAQSLQVPAFSPALIGLWAAGALAHAYGFRALMPLVVGVVTGVGWWIAQPLWDDGSVAGAVVGFGTAGVAAISLAVIHDRGLTRFGQVWRSVGALLGMVSLFIAAVPYTNTDAFEWDGWLVASLVVATVAAAAALVVARGRARLEPVVAVGVLAVAALMVRWDTGTDTSQVDLADWAHAAVGVVAFVALAVALVAIGTLRDNPVLTALAMVGLVAFTTFQSFAVFAAIVQGAWLFLVLGLIFLATGFLFDRARREIAASLEDHADTDQEGAGR
ncbi:membrane protein [Nocardioides sp. CF8]|nr:membrane protein [Nocardioides sp. CF8]